MSDSENEMLIMALMNRPDFLLFLIQGYLRTFCIMKKESQTEKNMKIEEADTIKGNEMIQGFPQFIKAEPIEEKPICDPEEDPLGFDQFCVNSNPLDIKSEDVNCFVGGDLVFKEKEQGTEFVVNNDPLNIKSEDVDIIPETNDIILKSNYNVVGEIIDCIKKEKLENESGGNNDNNPCLFEKSQNIIQQSIYDKFIANYRLPGFKNYKCELCCFSANQVSRMEKHMIVHKSSSEVQMYKCDACPFETRHKSYLKQHVSTQHEISLKPKKYSCEQCSYKTNHLGSMKNHLISHIYITPKKETKEYKCETCNYTTNKRYKLEKHMVIHKPPSEVEMYKCPLCPYLTKHRTGVPNHLLCHKKSSETPIFKCELCTYESKWRHCLRNHIRVHEKKSEKIPIHKCQVCEFETNNMYSLEQHKKLMHTVPPKKTKVMLSCYICEKQVEGKHKLARHMLSHTSSRMLECDTCGWKTHYKKSLMRHIAYKHGPISNIEIKPVLLLGEAITS
ncbi:hypothetical protein JTB14_024948 [Gonioctena quinquepunctata]|nr:hypothetical protein JTB14_024948 [Gonioctena quinquepunctata]